jgi:hypothetical protein
MFLVKTQTRLIKIQQKAREEPNAVCFNQNTLKNMSKTEPNTIQKPIKGLHF